MQWKTIIKYTAPLSLQSLICLAGTVESGIVAMIMERDPKAWALGFDSRLLASIYAGVLCPGIVYYVQGVVYRKHGSLSVTAFRPLCMIITAVLGAILLSERLHLGSLLGAIIIVMGLYSLLWGKSKEYGLMSERVAQELPVVNNQADSIDAPTMVTTGRG